MKQMISEYKHYRQKPFADYKERRRILLIDQEAHKRGELAEQLSERFDVVEKEDIEEGIRLLEERFSDFSVVILNEQIPGSSSSTLLPKITGNPFLAAVPAIVLSNRISPFEESRLLELGASDCIEMPVEKNVLLSHIFNLIRLKEMNGTLQYLKRDEQTGLLSKQAFAFYTKQLLRDNPDKDYALIMTDVDQFTALRAIYGEETANYLLLHIAGQLNQYAEEGICGRYTSDRLVCLMPAETVSRQWLEELLERMKERSPIVDAVVRCGVYQPIDRELSIQRIFDRTIFALKSIKSTYDEMIGYYDGSVSQRYVRELGYALRFQEALRNEEFEIWYQPKFDPYQNIMTGAEALVRWRNPDGSYNMPGEFLSLFESNGMIHWLDEYMFRLVCRQQKAWKDSGLKPVPVSINLSRRSMHQSGLAERYHAIAEEYEIKPEFLPIEITESTAIGGIQLQNAALQLVRQGFPIHMDDFGAGYSSMQTLNVLKFDTIKLDKGLIDFIGDEKGELILKYAMGLIKALEIKMVAEGVETQSQLNFLKENGCSQIQGFYYSKPLCESDFEELLPKNTEE